MLIFLLLIVMIAFVDLKGAKPGEVFDGYMSRENTGAVNGVFVLLIFLSHAAGYCKPDGLLDEAYLTFKNTMLQLVVVSFLFYSGYGMMESIRKKGREYVRSIPYKRFFKVYYRLFLSVCLFVLLNLAIGKNYGMKRTLLAFTGWSGIGNSNWYIFAVLVMYLIVFVSFLIFKEKHWLGVAAVTVLSAAFVVFQIRLDRNPWSYNTVMLFPAGMIFSLVRSRVDKIIRKNDSFWFLAVGVFLTAFIVCLYRLTNIVFYSVWALSFMAVLVLTTMKIQIKNPILSWFGSHVFSMYMLQRIPMILLTHFGLNESHKYAFVAISFAATVFLSHFFELAVGKIDGFLYSPKKTAQSGA